MTPEGRDRPEADGQPVELRRALRRRAFTTGRLRSRPARPQKLPFWGNENRPFMLGKFGVPSYPPSFPSPKSHSMVDSRL